MGYKELLDTGIEDIHNEKYSHAIEIITQSINEKNDWEISYFFRAVAYQALEQFDNAMVDYTKAIQINPKMTDAYYNKAQITLSRKDIPNPDIHKAIEDLEKALELDPKFLDALYAMAAAYKKIGKYNKAVEYLDTLLKHEPDAIQAKALKKLLLQKYIH